MFLPLCCSFMARWWRLDPAPPLLACAPSPAQSCVLVACRMLRCAGLGCVVEGGSCFGGGQAASQGQQLSLCPWSRPGQTAVPPSALHALMQEVSGAVKAQLEKQLTASLQASLAKPLQEAFR